MSLRDLYATKAVERVRSCRARSILEDLDGDDRAWLEESLASDITIAAIAETLNAAGYPIGHATLSKHRKMTCSCRYLR